MNKLRNLVRNLLRAPEMLVSVVAGLISVKASLESAIRRNDAPKAAALLRGSAPRRAGFLAGPLLLASRLGRVQMIRLLRQAGADPLEGGGAAVRAAADIGNASALEALIGPLGPKRSDIAEGGGSPKVALDYALLSGAFAGHVSLCRLLLESGANVDAREGGPDGLTSLMRAALVDNRDLLQLLISFGADVNSTAMGGYTPLMLGALHDHIHVLRALAVAGADPSLTERKGRTAMDLARSRTAAELLAFTSRRKDGESPNISGTERPTEPSPRT
jgi:Ankyrin repeats (3 copies)